MTEYTVEKLRVVYASGKYDYLELLLAYKDIVKGTEIQGILDYSTFPEVRTDLKQRILEVPKAQKVYSDYQNTLRKLVEKAEALELSGNTYFPFKEYQLQAQEILEEQLLEFITIKYEDLRSFYLEDANETEY